MGRPKQHTHTRKNTHKRKNVKEQLTNQIRQPIGSRRFRQRKLKKYEQAMPSAKQ